ARPARRVWNECACIRNSERRIAASDRPRAGDAKARCRFVLPASDLASEGEKPALVRRCLALAGVRPIRLEANAVRACHRRAAAWVLQPVRLRKLLLVGSALLVQPGLRRKRLRRRRESSSELFRRRRRDSRRARAVAFHGAQRRGWRAWAAPC